MQVRILFPLPILEVKMKVTDNWIVTNNQKVTDICCHIMESAIRHENIEWDSDKTFNIRDGAEISYCPWCGKKIEMN